MPNTQNFQTKPDGSQYGDMFRDLQDRVGQVDITGTTNANAGTVNAFPHGLTFTPAGAIVLYGEVYVTSVDATNVNVASAAASQNFRVRVVK